MFPKLMLVILAAMLTASALLVIRQQRLDLAHEASHLHRRISELEPTRWDLEVEIADRCHPRELRLVLEQVDEQLDSDPQRTTARRHPARVQGRARTRSLRRLIMTSHETQAAEFEQRQAERAGAWAGLFMLALAACFLLVLGRVVQLKTWPDHRLARAAGRSTSDRTEIARRGDLLDRQGRLLAASVVGYRLFVDPEAVLDRNTIAVDLAKVLGVDPIPIDRKIAARPDSRYVVIADPVDERLVPALRQADLAGVALEPRLVRRHPQGEIAEGIVGLVGFEHSGLGGFEHVFDGPLRQQDGQLSYLRDARRRPMWVTPEGYRPSRSGRDVRLSVDLIIQEIAERRLAAAVAAQNAAGGRLVVLECRTGELLAMADVLSASRDGEERFADPGREVNPGLARNRCVSDPYEPGSTFKPFVWAVATELGRARLDEVLPTPASGGHRTSQGRLIRDTTYHAQADWRTVLVKSINSGMAIVAERLTSEEMQDAVARFGFGRSTRCGVPGESRGLVTTPARWGHYTQTSVAMGHEIAVTPVQIVRAFSAFARDGTLPRLRITACGPDEEVYPFVHRVLPEWLAHTVKATLREVMLEGTGRRAQSDRYELFGKSGTAQLPRPDGTGYYEDRYVSSFIAGAPFREPRIVVLCVLDDPDRSLGHFGGAIAGPVVRDVIDETLQYLGVQEDRVAELANAR